MDGVVRRGAAETRGAAGPSSAGDSWEGDTGPGILGQQDSETNSLDGAVPLDCNDVVLTAADAFVAEEPHYSIERGAGRIPVVRNGPGECLGPSRTMLGVRSWVVGIDEFDPAENN